MDRKEVYLNMVKIFREVFNNESLEINDSTTASDIEEWDSFAQINLIVAIEDTFGIEIPLKKVNQMENVGQMIDYLYERVAG